VCKRDHGEKFAKKQALFVRGARGGGGARSVTGKIQYHPSFGLEVTVVTVQEKAEGFSGWGWGVGALFFSSSGGAFFCSGGAFQLPNARSIIDSQTDAHLGVAARLLLY